jgi:glycosyltransferase involved in cell wall biosynthesis
MKLSIIVPTYWGRNSSQGWQDGDLVFDHATPLDGEETLGRFLDSLNVLNSTEYELGLVVVPTCREIEEQVVARVQQVVESSQCPVKPMLFTPATIRNISEKLGKSASRMDGLLNMNGYAQVRNACLMAAALFKADVAVLIDDDEVFELRDFLDKVREGLNMEHYGKRVQSLAGYYINSDDDFLLKKETPSWGQEWPKYEIMDRGFDAFIASDPHYKVTPFVFGGNLSIHRTLYSKLPFDVHVTRGEDIDYLLMARMYGVPTILDNTLHIKHLAPPKGHPEWQQFRQDVIRFGFQRAKMRVALNGNYEGITPVTAEDLDPYPGFFLKDDLDARVEKSARSMAEGYRFNGDVESADNAMDNISLFRSASNPGFNPIVDFMELKSLWEELMTFLLYRRENDLW